MSAGEFPPLIWVDLIADEPKTFDEWWEHVDGVNPDGDFFADDAAIHAAYRAYVDRHQPWRILIKSGDNQEPLFKSTESYFNRADAIHAVYLAFGPGSNVYLRQAELGNQPIRMAAQ